MGSRGKGKWSDGCEKCLLRSGARCLLLAIDRLTKKNVSGWSVGVTCPHRLLARWLLFLFA